MNFLIDAHNTTSAGTISVTRNFLKGLVGHESKDHYYVVLPKLPAFDEFKKINAPNIKLIYIPQYKGIIQLISRISYQIALLPLLAVFIWPRSILALGNYLILPWHRKVVMTQQLFLTDDAIYNESSFKVRLEEGIVRLLFKLTLLSTKKVIVQRSRIKEQFADKYKIKNLEIIVLPTPVTDNNCMMNMGVCNSSSVSQKTVLYVSRFYKHKNHDFLFKIIEKYSNEFRERGIKFYVTVDPSLGKNAERFISNIKEKGIEDILINLSEIPPERIMELYRYATALFFPSKGESLGLPLIEAMSFGLPVIVPELEYALETCGQAGLYYKYDDIDSAYEHLIEICVNEKLWNEYSMRSREQFKKFPTIEKWTEEVLWIIRN